jgi:diguanylate cyclase (GGDEF)-like protein
MRNTWGRLRAGATPAEVRVLAFACAATGGMAGVAAAVPFSPTAPTRLNVTLLVLGMLLAGGLRLAGSRTPVAAVHAVVVVASLCVTVAVAASTTPAGTAVTALGFVWVALYSAMFHTRRAMVGHLALIVTGLAAGLVVAGATSPVQTWLFIAATVCVVAGVVNRDVTQLRTRADTDALTGTLSRTAFRSRAERRMAHARRRGERLTLALLDLDGFKEVNDVHGHAAGDRLLADLARVWAAALAPGDLLGRHGGDEFVVLVGEGRPGEEPTLGRLRSADSATWTVGAAHWSGEDFELWLARADEELYRRKRVRTSATPRLAGG